MVCRVGLGGGEFQGVAGLFVFIGGIVNLSQGEVFVDGGKMPAFPVLLDAALQSLQRLRASARLLKARGGLVEGLHEIFVLLVPDLLFVLIEAVPVTDGGFEEGESPVRFVLDRFVEHALAVEAGDPVGPQFLDLGEVFVGKLDPGLLLSSGCRRIRRFLAA